VLAGSPRRTTTHVTDSSHLTASSSMRREPCSPRTYRVQLHRHDAVAHKRTGVDILARGLLTETREIAPRVYPWRTPERIRGRHLANQGTNVV
jgi:hypothetical protein